MSKLRRVLSIAAVAAGLVAGTATVAYAGTPTPSPSVSSNFVVQPRLAPEQFNVLLADVGPIHVNTVQATGPVAFTAGTDAQNTPSLDTFSQVGDSVRVLHTPLRGVTVNYAACVIHVAQNGFWRFNGGTGADLNARGFGTFRLQAAIHFPVSARTGLCSIRFISPLRIQRGLNSGFGLPTPDSLVIAVRGTGLASV